LYTAIAKILEGRDFNRNDLDTLLSETSECALLLRAHDFGATGALIKEAEGKHTDDMLLT